MAGPNPYPLHSFFEMRKVMGRAYVYVGRAAGLCTWADGSTIEIGASPRSVARCAAVSDVVLEDPGKEGLQLDPQPNPPRHRLAMVRLQAIHQRASRFGRREPTREEARPRERPPRPPPDPVYRLVPLPFRTFH